MMLASGNVCDGQSKSNVFVKNNGYILSATKINFDHHLNTIDKKAVTGLGKKILTHSNKKFVSDFSKQLLENNNKLRFRLRMLPRFSLIKILLLFCLCFFCVMVGGCPANYCPRSGTQTNWGCCFACPGGTKQCLSTCWCRCVLCTLFCQPDVADCNAGSYITSDKTACLVWVVAAALVLILMQEQLVETLRQFRPSWFLKTSQCCCDVVVPAPAIPTKLNGVKTKRKDYQRKFITLENLFLVLLCITELMVPVASAAARTAAPLGGGNLGDHAPPNSLETSSCGSPCALVVYAYHDREFVAAGRHGSATDNLRFFIEHGVIRHSTGTTAAVLRNHVFVVVCQGMPAPAFVPRDRVLILERENSGLDFEAWYHGVHAALAATGTAQKYPAQSVASWFPLIKKHFDSFVFINSSVRGPYLPLWFHNLGVSWTTALTGGLNERVKLVGTTMNRCGKNGGWRLLPLSCSAPHVQSMVFATDTVGLELLFLPTEALALPIFAVRNWRNYSDTIKELEIGMSEAFRNAGFGVRAVSMSELVVEVQSRQDGNNGLGLHGDLQFEKLYFGHDINPLDSLFWKTNRGYTPAYARQYDQWLDLWSKTTHAPNSLHGADGDTLDMDLTLENLEPPVKPEVRFQKAATAHITYKSGRVVKRIKKFHKYNIIEREICVLERLQQFSWSPKLLGSTEESITLSFVGNPVTPQSLPDDYITQIRRILSDMKSVGVAHNDLLYPCTPEYFRKHEVMVLGDRLSVVDFTWSTIEESVPCNASEHMFAPEWQPCDDSTVLKVLDRMAALKQNTKSKSGAFATVDYNAAENADKSPLPPMPPPASGTLLRQSSLTRTLRRSVPETAVWSQARSCAFDHARDRVLLFDPESKLRHYAQIQIRAPEVVLAKSRYDSFAGLQGPTYDPKVFCKDSKVLSRIVKRPLVTAMDCSRILSEPVAIFKLINFRVGHLLADLVESVHQLRLQQPANTTFTFVLAAMDGSPWTTTFHTLFTVLAGTPPVLLSSFNAQGGVTCMHELFVGVDESKSYVSDGWATTMPSHPLEQQIDAYQHARMRFVKHLLLSYSVQHHDNKQGGCHIVHIVRGHEVVGARVQMSGRHIANSNEVLTALAGTALAGTECSVHLALLDDMSFKDQLVAFRRTDLLVGLAGSGLHNALFLKDKAVAISIMQPRWCNVRWWFERQMVLSNVWPLSLCDEPSPHRAHFRWHQSGWLVGPWYTKNVPLTVDIPLLQNAVSTASDIRRTMFTADKPAFRTQPRRPFCTAQSSVTGSCGGGNRRKGHEYEYGNSTLQFVAATGNDLTVGSSVDFHFTFVPVAVVGHRANMTQKPSDRQLDSWMRLHGHRLTFCACNVGIRESTRESSPGMSPKPFCRKHCLPLDATHEYTLLDLPAAFADTAVFKFWFELDGQLFRGSESAWAWDKRNRDTDVLASMRANDWHLRGSVSAARSLPADKVQSCTPASASSSLGGRSPARIVLDPFTIQREIYLRCMRSQLAEAFVHCVQCMVGAARDVF